jgi:uncharacterized protein YuzE
VTFHFFNSSRINLALTILDLILVREICYINRRPGKEAFMKIRYTSHARNRMRVRKVSEFEIEQTVLNPDIWHYDEDDDTKLHAIKNWGHRTLEIVYISEPTEIRIITVFIDLERYNMINFEYDEEADAIYIKIRDGDFAKNRKLSNSIILDLDEHEDVLGIEIINVSKLGGFSPDVEALVKKGRAR